MKKVQGLEGLINYLFPSAAPLILGYHYDGMRDEWLAEHKKKYVNVIKHLQQSTIRMKENINKTVCDDRYHHIDNKIRRMRGCENGWWLQYNPRRFTPYDKERLEWAAWKRDFESKYKKVRGEVQDVLEDVNEVLHFAAKFRWFKDGEGHRLKRIGNVWKYIPV